MSSAMPFRDRKRWSIALCSAIGLAAASAVFPQAASAEPADTNATGAQIHLGATLLEQELLNEDIVLVDTVAPAEGGTDADDIVGLGLGDDVDEFGLAADVIRSSSTFDADGTDADAEIVGADLDLFDVDVLHADVLEAEAICPVEGETSADANVAGLQLLDENVDLDADLPVTATVPVDVDLENVVDANLTVTLNQVEETGADSAGAAALIVGVALDATLTDQEVVTLDVGDIVLAEANCERPSEGPTGDGSDDGTDGDDGTGLPGLPGDGDDGAPEDGDDGLPGGDDLPGGDEDATPGEDEDGLPDDDQLADGGSADELSPDSGPAEGGTEVTIIGDGLDAIDTVTIDGETVDHEVADDGGEATFTTPGGEPGTVDVVVSFDDGSSDTLEFAYEDTEVLSEGFEADDDDDAATVAGGADQASAGALPTTGSSTTAGATALGLLLLAAGAHLLRRRVTA